MAGAMDAMDDAIKEYLLFRGFTHSLRVFENELKNDRDKGFQVDKIVGQLFSYIHASDLDGTLNFWDHLDRRFFSRLGAAFVSSVRKLELCLKRYYLVYAIQRNRPDKVTGFFEALAAELQGEPEWQSWFALPFVKSPETHPTYSTFFSRQWLETFNFSLHNFLNTVFQHMALPTLLSFEEQKVRLRGLEEEVRALKRVATYSFDVPKFPRAKGERGTTTPPPQPAAPAGGEGETTSTGRPEQRSASPRPQAKPSATPTPEPATAAPAATATTTPATDSTLHMDRRASAEEAPASPLSRLDSFAPITDAPPSPKPFAREPFIILDGESYEEHKAGLVLCTVSDQGQYVLSADRAGTVKVWTFTPVATKLSIKVEGQVLSAEWGKQNEHLAFVGTDLGKVMRIDVPAGTVTEYSADPGFPWATALASCPTGTTLVCSLANAKSEGQLVTLNPKTLTKQGSLSIAPVPHRVNCLCLNHNGTLLIAGAVDGVVRIADIGSNDFIVSWPAHVGQVLDARFSHDETSLFTVGTDALLCKWDSRGKLMDKWTSGCPDPGLLATYPQLCGLSFEVNDEFVLRCLPPDNPAALGATARVYEVGKDGQFEAMLDLDGHGGDVTCSDWCHTTHTCFTGSASGRVRVNRLFKVG